MKECFVQLAVLIVLIAMATGNVAPMKLLHRYRRWMMGNTRSGPICAFNPCTVQGFCKGGRLCQLDNKCLYHCVCVPGSTHEKCVTQRIGSSNKTVGKGDENDSFLLMLNVTKIGNPANASTLATPVENECPPGFPCEHGHCVISGAFEIECVCDSGWSGMLCNSKDPLQSCNESDCKSNEKCIIVSETLKKCVPRLTAQNDNLTAPILTQNTSNPCSKEYVIRDISERQCRSVGLSCMYGICVEEPNGSFYCKCDTGAVGLLCRDKCCLDCGEHGQCTRSVDRTEVCNCHFIFTGPQSRTRTNTDQSQQEQEDVEALKSEKTWYLWVVGVCAVVLFFLVVLLVLVPYVMWRHRIVMMMKLVHYFQGYEDDDMCEWDGFVFYQSGDKDETFVFHTLYPKLEKELGFKLHPHFKGFASGEITADIIIGAMSGSRRTILIITPKFVANGFTKLELKVKVELMKVKHRVIPILLEEIRKGPQIDPDLKQLIRSVPYIEWPGEDDEKLLANFWKRMFLLLPKKRTNSTPSHEKIEISVLGDRLPVSLSRFDNLGQVTEESTLETETNTGPYEHV